MRSVGTGPATEEWDMDSDLAKDFEQQVKKATAHLRQSIPVPTDGTEDQAVEAVLRTESGPGLNSTSPSSGQRYIGSGRKAPARLRDVWEIRRVSASQRTRRDHAVGICERNQS
jgi:hypothetical protein